MPAEPFEQVAAYQRLRLREIRSRCEGLNLDLEHYLAVERRVSAGIESLDAEFSETREALRSLGVDPGGIEDSGEPGAASGAGAAESPEAPWSPGGRKVGDGRRTDQGDFGNLVELAQAYLAGEGVEPDRDPLLQVLGSPEVSEIQRRYKDEFGDVEWSEADLLVVMMAGFIATLLDVFLVRIPLDKTFHGTLQKGSPLTEWIRRNSESIHHDYFEGLEGAAKVPYDLSIGDRVDGLRPKVHRLMSPGHDPLLGFVFGVIDIMTATGTYIDKNGDLIRVATSMSPEGLTTAFLKVFLHLLSDVGTSAGIQPPLFTLLQLVKSDSPFVLGPSGEKVSWTDVARYMYSNGYDLRHFATMGIVPASVEMIVRGWWLCQSYESGEDPEQAKAKLTSMLMLAHTTAASGNLLKTGAIFGMNPLALNWAQMLALAPVTLAWVRESLKRDRKIRRSLDAEWLSLYQANWVG